MRLGLHTYLLPALLCTVACSDDKDDSKSNDDDSATPSSASNNPSNSSGGSGGTDASGGSSSETSASGGSSTGGSAGSDTEGSGGSGTGGSGTGGSGDSGGSSNASQSATTGISPIPGDPGCGLDSAAFCDNFDEVADDRGRAGDLDPRKWSVSRGQPQAPTANGLAYGIGPVTLPPCRADQATQVFPSDDSLICDPTEQIHSNHLLTAVGAQNYGQNSYRIRQPFDFAGRTGKIVFDAEGWMPQLIGWPSIAVTEDPGPIPGYSLGPSGVNNDEGGSSPRRGFLVVFQNCQNESLAVRLIDLVENYEDIEYTSETCPDIETQQGSLHHFEITVAEDRIEVYGSAYSEDGVSFGEPQLLHSADVSLPFSRGYVSITLHNHASLKYSPERLGVTYDGWYARWDNVGFDGPVVENSREYEIPDALVPGESNASVSGPVMSVAYNIADEAEGPRHVLEFDDVDLTDVVAARLAVAAWYNVSEGTLSDFLLKYRLNGGTWHERALTEGEIGLLTSGNNFGQIAQMLDVPVDDLVEGKNTLEFVTVNVPQNYPPALSAIDLVLTTD